MRIFTQTQGAAFSNHRSESVPNRRALDSWDPSLAPPIAPQACPQKSRGRTETRSDHPEFDPICDEPVFQIKTTQRSAAHLLFENVNYLAQVLRQYISSHNVRGSVHVFVLVS
jgi:hypothetical protein